MASPNHLDVEKGPVQVNDQRLSTASSMPVHYTYASGASPLTVFQSLIGITTDSHLGGPDKPVRPRLRIRRIFFPPKTVGGTNVGLYQRAINEEWKARIAYFLSSFFLNFTYILQILLAATFTALSASQHASTVPLTVLGALNTVIAGILAWLKGQGIPNRFRRARDQYANIVKEIEVTERMFAEWDQLIVDGETKPDPRGEAKKLVKMYDTAKLDQQNNYPDMYVSSHDTMEKVIPDPEVVKKEVARKAEDAIRAEFEKREQGLMERLQILEDALIASHTGESAGARVSAAS